MKEKERNQDILNKMVKLSLGLTDCTGIDQLEASLYACVDASQVETDTPNSLTLKTMHGTVPGEVLNALSSYAEYTYQQYVGYGEDVTYTEKQWSKDKKSLVYFFGGKNNGH